MIYAPVVGILLAAGSATRFGGDKLAAALPNGTTVGVAACRNLAAAVDAVIAVVRPGDGAIADALAANRARVSVCPRASDGMGASLAWGVRAAPVATGWIIALADMPGGHQPAPIVGNVFTTQSVIESEGFSITSLDLFSEPPPLAAIFTSTVPPGTRSKCTTAGVLSLVFFRAPAGSATIDPRSVLSGCV